MPTKQQIDDLRNSIDLREFVISHGATFPLLGKSGSQVVGPCPRCGGDDRFHVHRDTWGCRQCAPVEKGKRHDIYDLIRLVCLASNFREAYEYAVRWANMPTAVNVDAGHRQPPTRRERKPVSQEWVSKYVTESQSRLSGPSLAYLIEKRGLAPETIKTFGLGFHPSCKLPESDMVAPAIVIPWRNSDGFSRIGLRYLETQEYTNAKGKPITLKYRVTGGLEWRFDALFSLARGSDTLAIVEGEFNAMSIAQVTSWDVVSFGSQEISQAQIEQLRASASDYCIALVWCDDPAKAAQLKGTLKDAGCRIIAVKSPNNLDANDLLQRGILREFLARVSNDLSLADLTDWIGQTVDQQTSGLVREECERRYGDGWQIIVVPAGDAWQITELIAYADHGGKDKSLCDQQAIPCSI